MFKKLRNKILVSNMVVLSLLTVVALSSIYVIAERMVHAENQQMLAEEVANQTNALTGMSALLNTEGWAYMGYQPAASIRSIDDETGETTEIPGSELFHFLYTGGDSSLTPSLTVFTYSNYPTEAYREARRLLPEHTADSRYSDYHSVTVDGRTWLARRIATSGYMHTDTSSSGHFPSDVAAPEPPLTIPEGLVLAHEAQEKEREALAQQQQSDAASLPEEERPSIRHYTYTPFPEERIEQLTAPRLALVDITDSLSGLDTLRWILMGSVVVLLATFFFLSRFIANRAVRPAEASWMRQRQFMSDASHEFKTPLAIIKTSQEVLQKNSSQSVESQQKWLKAIETETESMASLVDTLLDLSKGDEAPAVLEMLDISSLVSGVCTEFEALFFEKGLALQVEISPGLIVKAEADTLKSAFTPLFENALNYTPAGKDVFVTLAQKQGHVLFAIKNTGVSLSQEELTHIFDRFYRVDQARSSHPDASGFGLGLAIAQNAVLRSKGSIKASSDDDSVTIEIRL